MKKDLQLIKLYCTICRYYSNTLVSTAQRQSNNFCPKFTDEECITIYIWGIKNQKFTVKGAYEYIQDHYSGWFPELPSYQAFNSRVCYLADALYTLADILLTDQPNDEAIKTHIIDSMPIVVANAKRSSSAVVAPELCDKGYCASKNMYYYGVKLHVLTQSRYQTLPIPKQICLTAGSENDLPVGKRMLDDVYEIDLIADKMYKDAEWEAQIKEDNNITVFTPVKLKKGQQYLESADKLLSTAVSKARQPIESFFNWLEEKTNIQHASKVRSTNGLVAFLFARIASILI